MTKMVYDLSLAFLEKENSQEKNNINQENLENITQEKNKSLRKNN